MWQFHNPVRVRFGDGAFDELPRLIGSRRYALVTYAEAPFDALRDRLIASAGAPVLSILDIAPNPNMAHVTEQCRRLEGHSIDVIVAVGGGSVIDSAKVFATAAPQGFAAVRKLLETGEGRGGLSPLPVIAVPTTAGTGSEVTPWGTIWEPERDAKYSLNLPGLFPETALVDPQLTLSLPRGLTISTALDAFSHALESLWNRNANPVSAGYAVRAARAILEVLPRLAETPDDLPLRGRMALAALEAGLAFSNTKTALAHALSYPVTMRHGVVHGVACSFTLPLIVRSFEGLDHPVVDHLRTIFDADPAQAGDRLETFLHGLGVSTLPSDHGVNEAEWHEIVEATTRNERGQNFAGSAAQLDYIAAAPTWPASAATRN